MAGMKVVSVKTLVDGSLDLEDLKTKAEKHKDNLAAFMVMILIFAVQTVSLHPVDHLPLDVRCI